MTQKISDFKIAEFLLRAYCQMGKTMFIDLPIHFVPTGTENAVSCYQGNGLSIVPQEKLSKTCFSIIGTYVSFADIISKVPPQISNEDKLDFISMAVAVLRDITHSPLSTTVNCTGNMQSKLNRLPLIWLLMRDVICPSFNRSVQNISVIVGRSGRVDGAVYLENGIDKITEPLIFSNLEIDNPHCRSAYLLLEAIRAHDLNPEAVINEIFKKPEISSKLIGLIKAAYTTTDNINDFLMMLCLISGYKATDEVLIHEAGKKWNQKIGLWSQAQTTQNTWWYLGLIEKMLDPARAPDWTGYFHNKAFMDDLWTRVEAERKRRNLKELPLELLLRVQSEEFKQRPDLTIQGLLADNRVW